MAGTVTTASAATVGLQELPSTLPPLPQEFFSHADDSIVLNQTSIDGEGGWNMSTPGDMTNNGTSEGSSGPVVVRHELTLTGYFVMGGFLAILALCVVIIVWHICRYRRQRYRLSVFGGGASSAAAASASNTAAMNRCIKQRIQRRYETVEHWIISKTVLVHTDFCAAVVSNFAHHDHIPTNGNETDPDPLAYRSEFYMTDGPAAPEQQQQNDGSVTIKIDTEADSESAPAATSQAQCCPTSGVVRDNDQYNPYSHDDELDVPECPICMLELTPGEIVSWSANEQCCHVYHHECIKEWLLRNTQCCMCKAVYLPVDEKQGKEKTLALNELSLQFAAAAATSYYCAKSGLVRIPKTVRCTRQELYQLERRVFDGAVPPAKLVSLRGSRPESTCQSSKSRQRGAAFDDDDVIIQEAGASNHRDDSVQTDELTGSIDLNSSSFDNLSSSDLNISSGNGESGGAEVGTSLTTPQALDALYQDMEVGSSSLLSLMETPLSLATKVDTSQSPTDQSQEILQQTGCCPELLSATEYLEQNSLASFPDSRWCIQTSDENDLESGGVEIQETTSAEVVDDAANTQP